MRAHTAEAEILALGWDTESTTSQWMRATRGTVETPWRATWEEVLADVTMRQRGYGLKTSAVLRMQDLAGREGA